MADKAYFKMKERTDVNEGNCQLLKIISVVLYVAAVGFCVLGFIGHSAAWAAAALSFFAATMMMVRRQKDKQAKTDIKDHIEEEGS